MNNILEELKWKHKTFSFEFISKYKNLYGLFYGRYIVRELV